MKLQLSAMLMLTLLIPACDGSTDPETGEDVASLRFGESGKHLFEDATFGGNGRTCATCHSAETGTVSIDDAAARFAADPTDPLFRPIDCDDAAAATATYDRLTHHATILVGIDLPANVTLQSDPSQRKVTFERTIPTTLNTPALDTVLMWDGRVETLADQAKGAIMGHAQAPTEPDDRTIDSIVRYEQDRLFSSKALETYARKSSPAPSLPEGTTDSEKRGRAFFDGSAPNSLCAHCHSGPMLNESNGAIASTPAGARFANVRVSAFNARALPLYTFVFDTATGPVTVRSPDPGRALITGDPKDVDKFKIPSLWNIKNTAPYFHDASAATLEEVLAHYAQFFATVTRGTTILSAQDQADIVAYLKLL